MRGTLVSNNALSTASPHNGQLQFQHITTVRGYYHTSHLSNSKALKSMQSKVFFLLIGHMDYIDYPNKCVTIWSYTML
jgi:hypothetical protein